MSNKANQTPKFFKVMVKDFTSKLQLPPAFVGKHGEILPKIAKIRVSSGDTWDVKLEKVADGCFFTSGWKEFALDVSLKTGEFLVFWFVGKSTFDVSILGISTCNREALAGGTKPDKEALSEGPENTNLNGHDGIIRMRRSMTCFMDKEGSPLYFEILLKLQQQSRVTIPKKFIVAAGLKREKFVTLEYLPRHHHQTVVLDHISKSKTDMTVGWPNFRKANGLVYGEMYSFEFNPSRNVIQVKKLEN